MKVEPVDLKSLYAHTPPEGSEKWDTLYDHLVGVAQKARCFAEPFGAGALAYAIGLWHDLGKINPEFQAYLEAMHKGQKCPKVPHSIWAGALAYALIWLGMKDAESWKELALPLAGHHSGLDQPGVLSQKLHAFVGDEQGKKALCLLQKATTQLQAPAGMRMQHASQRGRDLLIRMVFSALVDADYLATECHFDQAKSDCRSRWPSLSQLWDAFLRDQSDLLRKAAESPTPVNRVRRVVYESCLSSANKKPGLFRLTVPTGGGKTRSGLAFALKHALKYQKDRVIVALPYTSIIDQTAKAYREIFAPDFDCVLEHHSQADIPDEQEDQESRTVRGRLAAENWDAPLIVTTTVQLFESLFGCKPARCRKLHNIANSVLILDEVQTLPCELLAPTLDVIRLLVEQYNTTVVLSTATQPAFDETPYLTAFEDLPITPIVEDYRDHFRLLERVEYQPIRKFGSLTDLANEIVELPVQQVLVILNTRKHALGLLNELRARKIRGLYHLSTLLCGAHRRAILEEIKTRLDLNNPQPVCLISTQVVEAGVDLDFPTVYRAMGPLDRIVQAAGRCNREGRRSTKGQVTVFDWPENTSPPGSYRIGVDDARMLLERNDSARLSDPDLHREYFRCLFRDADLDRKNILPYCRDLDFPEVAARYRFIEETIPVVVPGYNRGEGEKRLHAYVSHPSRGAWRKLMPYVVNIRRQEMSSLQYWLEPVVGAFYRWTGIYDADTHRGLVGPLMDPADLFG